MPHSDAQRRRTPEGAALGGSGQGEVRREAPNNTAFLGASAPSHEATSSSALPVCLWPRFVHCHGIAPASCLLHATPSAALDRNTVARALNAYTIVPRLSTHPRQNWRSQNERRHPKFEHPQILKAVGINSQREIEHVVAKGHRGESIAGTESFPAKMTLEIPGLKVKVEFGGDIILQ